MGRSVRDKVGQIRNIFMSSATMTRSGRNGVLNCWGRFMCLCSVTDVCRRRKREIGETENDLREVLRASNGARCGERKTSAQKFPQTQTLLQRASSLTFSPRKYSLIVVIRTAAGMKSGGGTQVGNSYWRGRSGQLKGRNFRKWNPNKEYTKFCPWMLRS